MATRTTPFAAGTPCWVELLSSDTSAATAFYGGLFGWSFDPPQEQFGGYVNITSGGHRVAGMMANSPEINSPDAWTTYLSTDDIDASTAAVAAGGGQLVAAPMQVADLGSMAVVRDPAGAVFGLWQPGTHFGFAKYNEPGSVTWDELHSKDFAVTTPFYASVFGWDIKPMEDTDEFRYSTAEINGETVAGLMDSASFLPPEVPSHWAVYFSVVSADDAITTLTSLGGTVIRPAEDTPYGRMADVADPTGAAFKLHQATPAG
jgi:uncharacterized protein